MNLGAIPSIFDDESSPAVGDANIQKNAERTDKISKYCKIKHCKYEVGTKNEKILFFG